MTREVYIEQFSSWFIDESKSGGIVLDLMIHDITMLVLKFGKPKVIAKKFIQGETCITEARVVLDFGGFNAKLRASWQRPFNLKPIASVIQINDDDVNPYFECDRYTTWDPYEDDPFKCEIKAFLAAIDTKKTYPVSGFLDAIEVALDIIGR